MLWWFCLITWQRSLPFFTLNGKGKDAIYTHVDYFHMLILDFFLNMPVFFLILWACFSVEQMLLVSHSCWSISSDHVWISRSICIINKQQYMHSRTSRTKSSHAYEKQNLQKQRGNDKNVKGLLLSANIYLLCSKLLFSPPTFFFIVT